MIKSPNYLPVRTDWLAQWQEPPLEPALTIVDAHHHFYDRPGWRYLADDFLGDASQGHHVRASVYMQALTRYRTSGSAALAPVGETEYVVSATADLPPSSPKLAQGIVGHADLRLGAEVLEVLEAHLAAGQERFRGVRHLSTWDSDSSLANPLTAAPPGLLLDDRYRAGVAELARLGLSFDAWLFFPQVPDLVDLAGRFETVPFIVNHCGGVVRIGAYAEPQDEVFAHWRAQIASLARLPNVTMKLGGLGMRLNGFGFHKLASPPSSQLLAATWRPWILACIDSFGPDRCMFESNFPVDKGSCTYGAVWNAFKRLSAGFSPSEREALFSGTARRIYRLDRPEAATLPINPPPKETP